MRCLRCVVQERSICREGDDAGTYRSRTVQTMDVCKKKKKYVDGWFERSCMNVDGLELSQNILFYFLVF